MLIGLSGRVESGGGDEENELGLEILGGLFSEEGAEERAVAEDGSGVFNFLLLIGDEAAEEDGVAAGEGNFFIEAALFENGLSGI